LRSVLFHQVAQLLWRDARFHSQVTGEQVEVAAFVGLPHKRFWLANTKSARKMASRSILLGLLALFPKLHIVSIVLLRCVICGCH
jgi:hypothetical protein